MILPIRPISIAEWRPRLLAHLASRHERFPREDDWSLAVAGGDLSAIPDALDWDNASGFAHRISGYELAPELGLGDCGRFANLCSAQAEEAGGAWVGNLAELWICLFFEYRRWRHFGDEPMGEERTALDALCRAVVEQARLEGPRLGG